ncbi:hypothetical protein N2152v2_008232 [Parachlorella kessleri]
MRRRPILSRHTSAEQRLFPVLLSLLLSSCSGFQVGIEPSFSLVGDGSLDFDSLSEGLPRASLHLACNASQVLRVNSASWGVVEPGCYAKDAKSKVAYECEGLDSCTISDWWDFFGGHPCTNDTRYYPVFQVNTTCVAKNTALRDISTLDLVFGSIMPGSTFCAPYLCNQPVNVTVTTASFTLDTVSSDACGAGPAFGVTTSATSAAGSFPNNLTYTAQLYKANTSLLALAITTPDKNATCYANYVVTGAPLLGSPGKPYPVTSSATRLFTLLGTTAITVLLATIVLSGCL